MTRRASRLLLAASGRGAQNTNAAGPVAGLNVRALLQCQSCKISGNVGAHQPLQRRVRDATHCASHPGRKLLPCQRCTS